MCPLSTGTNFGSFTLHTYPEPEMLHIMDTLVSTLDTRETWLVFSIGEKWQQEQYARLVKSILPLDSSMKCNST